ncbi:MAG: site-specific integrase [Planctomycetota bacterium]|jgi:site-specific recombinase XerD
MIDQFFSNPKVLKRLHLGPLGTHMDSFAQTLMMQGYKRNTAKQKIRIVADLSRWLDQQRLSVKDLDEITLNEYLMYKGRRGSIFKIEPPTLRALLEHLRETGVVADSVRVDDDSNRSRIESGFAEYLAQERGLKQVTIDNYLSIAGRFLSDQFGTGPIVLNGLHPNDIVRFILQNTETVSAKRAQLIVISLRSFFRFLYQRGETANDLSPSALTVANWRLSELPKFLEPEQVECLLQSCNQDTLIGQRDYVILLLLARLGLRAGDVVHMTLDDIDWEVGELIVRGKSHRQERLPLPQDVGEALVRYLRHGRPRCSSRRVFIRIRAPHKGFSSSVAICNIVRRALVRAKLNPAFKGSHLLRHSLATQMLRGGASLAEIGEILRHQRLNTTQIYAKVDLAALRALAQPWPGGEI